MVYRCRSLVPRPRAWREIPAKTPPLAVREYHTLLLQEGSTEFYFMMPDATCWHFLRAEVEGEFKRFSRLAGPRPLFGRALTIEELARAIHWDRDPHSLVHPWHAGGVVESAHRSFCPGHDWEQKGLNRRCVNCGLRQSRNKNPNGDWQDVPDGARIP